MRGGKLLSILRRIGARPRRDAAAVGPLTRIAEVRSLSREAAAQGLPIQVRGVVTRSNHAWYLALQDESGGIWVNLNEAKKKQAWQGDSKVFEEVDAGMEVEIEGLSAPGGYAPFILPKSLRILGPKPLPPAAPFDPAMFFNGADAGQRVEARGVVQGAYPWENGVILVIDTNPGRFVAQIPPLDGPAADALVDAQVRLRGVVGTRFNTRGEATGARMFVSVLDDLVVEKPSPPFDSIPRVSLSELLPFRVAPHGPHRVRVQGIVTFAYPGKSIYVQHGDSAVRVDTSSSIEFKSGDLVEAAGFVDMSRFIGTLGDATVRKIGSATPLAPLCTTPQEIIDLNSDASSSGQTATPHD